MPDPLTRPAATVQALPVRSTAAPVRPALPAFVREHATAYATRGIALLFWLALVGGYAFYTVANGLTPLESFRRALAFMADNPAGPLIFVAIYALRPLVFFSAALLSVGAGFLFGPLWGVVLTVVGANAGASLAYLIGRTFGAGSLESAEGEGWVRRYAGRLRANSFETVLTMRFIFLPFDLVNYLAGFLRVRYGAFLLATVLGSLPGTIAFVLFGASTDGEFTGGLPSLDPTVLAVSVGVFVASLALSRLLKRREAQREGAR